MGSEPPNADAASSREKAVPDLPFATPATELRIRRFLDMRLHFRKARRHIDRLENKISPKQTEEKIARASSNDQARHFADRWLPVRGS